MKHILAVTSLLCGFITPSYATTWQADTELSGFQTTTIELPDDYDGKAVATLIRQRSDIDTQKAVLYIHGYSDYFFQEEMASKYTDNGYNFYALDLRKYGRSMLPNQHPNIMKDISEYDEEITTAISMIRGEENNTKLLLSGHSTGGLISAIYADKYQDNNTIDAIFLNSPYLAETPGAIAIINAGKLCPYCKLPTPPALKVYGQSLSSDFYGEWSFNYDWKPVENSSTVPVYAGWYAAVYEAQRLVHKGLDIKMPILIMHSKYSSSPLFYTEEASRTDTVLNVKSINKYSDNLGDVVTKVRVEDGLHDLVLSRGDVRERVYTELFRWLDGYMK